MTPSVTRHNRLWLVVFTMFAVLFAQLSTAGQAGFGFTQQATAAESLFDKNTISATVQSTNITGIYKVQVSGNMKATDISTINVKIENTTSRALYTASTKRFTLSKSVKLNAAPTKVILEATTKSRVKETYEVAVNQQTALIEQIKVTKGQFSKDTYAYIISGKVASTKVKDVTVKVGNQSKKATIEESTFKQTLLEKKGARISLEVKLTDGQVQVITIE
ncbi:hypothetical protein [Brevibacillus dissolubilis]|uniref:hypothetical protein n=1 Tax=Brevibacillus dissolubilis TaxID=1844116 RepID=UPI0011177147|nr:hypothetical protein [Brevibacillus dissolubilis]